MSCKVTHCTERVTANIRSHRLHQGDWEMGTAISCTCITIYLRPTLEWNRSNKDTLGASSCVPISKLFSFEGENKDTTEIKALQDMRPSAYLIPVTSGHILSLSLHNFSSPGVQFEGVSTANIRCCRATYESHCNCPSCKAYVKFF